MPYKVIVSGTRTEITYTMTEFQEELRLPSKPLAVYSQAGEVVVVLTSEGASAPNA